MLNTVYRSISEMAFSLWWVKPKTYGLTVDWFYTGWNLICRTILHSNRWCAVNHRRINATCRSTNNLKVWYCMYACGKVPSFFIIWNAALNVGVLFMLSILSTPETIQVGLPFSSFCRLVSELLITFFDTADTSDCNRIRSSTKARAIVDAKPAVIIKLVFI